MVVGEVPVLMRKWGGTGYPTQLRCEEEVPDLLSPALFLVQSIARRDTDVNKCSEHLFDILTLGEFGLCLFGGPPKSP